MVISPKAHRPYMVILPTWLPLFPPLAREMTCLCTRRPLLLCPSQTEGWRTTIVWQSVGRAPITALRELQGEKGKEWSTVDIIDQGQARTCQYTNMYTYTCMYEWGWEFTLVLSHVSFSLYTKNGTLLSYLSHFTCIS